MRDHPPQSRPEIICQLCTLVNEMPPTTAPVPQVVIMNNSGSLLLFFNKLNTIRNSMICNENKRTFMNGEIKFVGQFCFPSKEGATKIAKEVFSVHEFGLGPFGEFGRGSHKALVDGCPLAFFIFINLYSRGPAALLF